MPDIQLEICCGSSLDVHIASSMGADRVELNNALPLGGLTPSYGTLQQSLDASIPIFVMIRPRPGGFAYSDSEFNCMVADAKQLLAMGARGIVFGLLNPDKTIDTKRCAQLMSLTDYPPCVFHRAFDLVPDWRYAIDQLTELGFCRILTSGQEPTAIDGMKTLRRMNEYAKERIEIMPGCGIRPDNAGRLIKNTGCISVHASLRHSLSDTSISDTAINFYDPPGNQEILYQVDPQQVSEMLRVLA